MKTPYDVIKAPIITERSMDDAAERKYSFKVDVKATKTEIKQAVEEIFGVEVAKVNTMNYDGTPIQRTYIQLPSRSRYRRIPHSRDQ